MALSQLDEKYINQTLAGLHERVLLFARRELDQSYGLRQRAIFAALALETTRIYNHIISTLGTVGTSKLAKEAQAMGSSFLLDGIANITSDEEIELIIDQIYNSNSKARAEERALINKEKAQAKALGIKMTAQVQFALKTLAEAGALNKLIDVDKFIQLPPTLPNKPRGNPAKGGLVRKFMHDGYAHESAEQLAEEELINRAKDQTSLNTAIASSSDNMTIAKAIEITNKEPKKDSTKDLLAMLNFGEEESVDNTNTNPLSDPDEEHSLDSFFTEEELKGE